MICFGVAKAMQSRLSAETVNAVESRIKMGVARSKFSKMFTNTFRGETRMLKEVSKEKPMQAPRHPSTEEAFKKLLKGILSCLGIRGETRVLPLGGVMHSCPTKGRYPSNS